MVISSVLLAVAPKCPFCLMAFFGAVGSAAVTAPFYRAWLAPLTAIWLGLTRIGVTERGPILRSFNEVAHLLR